MNVWNVMSAVGHRVYKSKGEYPDRWGICHPTGGGINQSHIKMLLPSDLYVLVSFTAILLDKKDFNREKFQNETQNQFSKLWCHKYWRKINFFIFHGIWRVPGWYAYWKASKCHKWKTTQLYILRGYFKFFKMRHFFTMKGFLKPFVEVVSISGKNYFV